MPEKNSKKLRKISIDDVEIGMVLEDIFNSQGTLLFSENMVITSGEQIEQLRRRNVESVYINIDVGKDISPEKCQLTENDQTDYDREAAYFAELSIAKEVHRKTLETARSALLAARMGKQFAQTELENTAVSIVESILRNPDALVSLSQIKGYDEYTYVHSVNVGILITSLAHAMHYPSDQLFQAGMGGLLHDIGKMKVPEHILNKKGKYTDVEFAIMKKHPVLGLEILNGYKGISDESKLVVIEHHERCNGSGYPRNLKYDEIHEIGLIAAVADVYDAMTTDRVYRTAWPPQKALAMIFQGSDKDYSRRIVELFTKNLGIYPVGSFVKLATGEKGVVIRVTKGELLAPDILVLFAPDGKRLKIPYEYKLAKKQKDENGDLFRIEVSLNPKDYNVNINEYISGNPFE